MRIMRFVGVALCGLAMLGAIPAEAGQQAAPAAGVCGASSYCYDASNFTATVTTFRVSTNNVYKQKIIDVTVRFQNKTTQAVVLAYVDHSGLATDDRGNRSIPWGPNAYRGIGLVSGTTFDPKLVVRPGAWGDAQFELVQQGTPPVTGMSYVLDLTIDEINNSGGQPTLGGEFPVHFEGLVNGAAGTVPALSGLAGGPCALQAAANKAASAANAISNLGSLFGKKKTAQTAGQVAAAAGCDASANTTGSTSGTIAATTASAATQPSTPAAAANANEVKAKNPPAANTTPAHTSGDRSGASSQAAQPWTPPSDAAEEKEKLKDPLALPIVAKMPDVVGVRVGMSEQEAAQILRGQYPRGQFQPIPAGGIFPTNPKADYGFNILPTNEIATDVVVSLTAPPSRQVVWHIVRFTRRLHANHANVLATLREKYGKESFAGRADGSKTTDDRNIGTLFWIFDEQGNRAPMPSAEAFSSNDITFCLGRGIALNPGPRIPMDEVKDANWCASFVGVVAQIDPFEIVENTTVAVMDMRLANRTANAYLAWKRDADAKARAAAVEQSKKNKPVF
jgi:hypothetical protein